MGHSDAILRINGVQDARQYNHAITTQLKVYARRKQEL
jgi:hypothetical protein